MSKRTYFSTNMTQVTNCFKFPVSRSYDCFTGGFRCRAVKHMTYYGVLCDTPHGMLCNTTYGVLCNTSHCMLCNTPHGVLCNTSHCILCKDTARCAM